MNKLFVFAFLLICISVNAQKIFNPKVFANSITAADLKQHLYIIAGKEMEGRETATEGQRKAAAYIENQFKQIGLQPGNNGSYQLYYPVYQDSLLNAVFEVNGKNFGLDKDFNVNLNNISATQAFSEVIYLSKNVTADSIKKENFSGKIIMIAGDVTQGNRGASSARMEALRNTNPAAVLTVSSNFPRLTAASRKGNQTLNFFKKSIAPQQFTVSENVAKEITGSNYADASSSTGKIIIPAELLLDVKKTTIKLQSSNVIGILPALI